LGAFSFQHKDFNVLPCESNVHCDTEFSQKRPSEKSGILEVFSHTDIRTMTQLSHLTSINTRLINGLQRLQASGLNLPLIPLNDNKQPLGDSWQNRPFKADELIKAIENGGVDVPIQGKNKKIPLQGVGLLTGRPITIDGQTYYLMALDQDGASAESKIEELSDGQPLPKTVAFSSGRPGRCQYLFLVPEEYKDAIRTKKIKTGIKGDDGKIEQVEFRYHNLQSVLPPSVHPTTGQYHWVSSCAIDETQIAFAPTWVIEQMLIETTTAEGSHPQALPFNGSERVTHSEPLFQQQKHCVRRDQKWTDIDFALSYLNALSSNRADDYDEWLNVGMALHSVDDSLLNEWDIWSQQSSKYKPGACEKKWKSFSNHGGITLGTLAHLAKLDGWQFPFAFSNSNSARSTNQIKTHNGSGYSLSRSKKTTVTGDTFSNIDRANQDPLSLSETVTTVTTLLKAGYRDYQERAELDAICERSSMSKNAFTELVKAIRCELDEIQPSDNQRLNQLIDWHNATLDFNQVLPPPLADALLHDALILNIDPVSLWQYLLPTTLSLVGKRVNLDAESHQIPAIAWTCLVAESGTGKTRAENVILAPIKERQYREYERFQDEIKKYKEQTKTELKDDKKLSPPKSEKKYLFEVATIQAMMRRLAEQEDNGSLWARDEIAGLFKSLKQFSKQDNEALECLLKMWDGTGSFVERMDAEHDSYSVFETRLSLTGGIQPGAFRQAFKDPDDVQGLQARMLFALPKVMPAKRVKGYCVLSDLLPPLYDWLENCPRGIIKLSREADLRYTHLVEILGKEAESCPTPAIRAWMRKLPTQLLRIALALHLLECFYERNRNFWVLGSETLEKALEICRYYRSVFQVVQEKVAESDSISSILLKIWDSAITQPNGVTPRDVYRSVKAIAHRAKELGRSVAAYTIDLMTQLVQMGKGTIEKNGRTVRFIASVGASNVNPFMVQTPVEPQKMNNLQSLPQNSDFHSNLPITNHARSSTVGSDGRPLSEPLVKCAISHIDALSVTEVTENESQANTAIEPSPLTELSPVTKHSTLQPIDLSDPPIWENYLELASSIPDEHRESIAEVCAWIELLLPDGGQALGEIMALIKEIFASEKEARKWIWRSLSESVKQLLWQVSPDDCSWLRANDVNHSV
jgi:hypothetical protein